VLFCRRARNGGGQQAPQAELERFLGALRDKPPSEAELDAARRAVAGELALPGAAPILPSALPGRAIVALLAGRRGIDGPAIAAVTAAAVQEVLVAALAPERAWWGGLLPEAPSLLRPGTSR